MKPRKLARATLRFVRQQSPSVNSGHSVDADGQPVPWYTWPAIAHLDQHDWTGANVLEWGSGNSTLWWSDRAGHVITVDNDPVWTAEVVAARRDNVIAILQFDEHAYVHDPGDGPFDVVVVDGRWREACVDRAIEVVADTGMVVLDNADRYPEMCGRLRGSGRYQIDFRGFGPINPYESVTSVFVGPAVSVPSVDGRPLPRAAY